MFVIYMFELCYKISCTTCKMSPSLALIPATLTELHTKLHLKFCHFNVQLVQDVTEVFGGRDLDNLR